MDLAIVHFFFFCFGLIIGSFLNVVLFRTRSEERLTGRSRCRSCGQTIFWYDNIPVVSFLLLSGKCRRCAAPIAWRYPLIELLTGILFYMAGWLLYEPGELLSLLHAVWWCFLFAVLILIAFYDLDSMEIPVSFLLWGIGGTIVYFLLETFLEPSQNPSNLLFAPISQALVGGGIASGFFYLLVWMSKEKWMGMGDVWLAFLSGMSTGPRPLLLLLSLSFTFGAAVACFLLLTRRKDMSSQVPFAPYLCFGTVVLLILLAIHPAWLSLFLFPTL